MPVNKNQYLKLRLLLLCFLANATLYAQSQPETIKVASTPGNAVEILMIIVALVLAFVIWGLGQVLQALARQSFEKSNSQKRPLPVIMAIGFLLFAASSHAQDLNTVEIAKTLPNYGGMNSTDFWVLTITMLMEMTVIGWLLFAITRLQDELIAKKIKKPNLKQFWFRLDKKLLTRAVAVEKEADILLDHDYDGIRELDNSLPPWWKYGFIITIIIAFVYLLNFHVLGYGKNPTEEYQAEMAQAQLDKEEFEAKNVDKIDESNLKMPDENGIAAGREIFTTTCWACHGKLCEGGAGPNLTDDYWLHSGSLTDIYKSIKHGYPEKGMQAWEKNFSPKEINSLAGFIKTLKGTNPANPKAPQGDIFTESGEAMPGINDIKNHSDSIKNAALSIK